MSNSYNEETALHIVDSTGALSTVGVCITKVVFFPATKATDTLVLTDSDDNVAITLKANELNIDVQELDFGDKGRRLPSLKVGTIGGGSAHIYLRDDIIPKIG